MYKVARKLKFFWVFLRELFADQASDLSSQSLKVLLPLPWEFCRCCRFRPLLEVEAWGFWHILHQDHKSLSSSPRVAYDLLWLTCLLRWSGSQTFLNRPFVCCPQEFSPNQDASPWSLPVIAIQVVFGSGGTSAILTCLVDIQTFKILITTNIILTFQWKSTFRLHTS